MERIEKIGLGVALLGHAGLMGGFYLGTLFDEEVKLQPASISVDIVADIADISTAPDAIQEEPAPSDSEELIEEITPDELAEPEPEPEPEKVSEPEEVKTNIKDNKAAQDKKRIEAAKKAKAKLLAEEKKKADAKKRAEAKKRADAKKRAEDKRKKGFLGQGNASGTPASQTAAEVRRSINVSLRQQIEGKLRGCAPPGVDSKLIATVVTFNLNRDRSLKNISKITQQGVNSNNSKQAPLHKECVQDAIRAAAPFKNLSTEDYSVWKKWTMRIKAR